MAEKKHPTADQYKHRFKWLAQFSDEELREISLCGAGEGLQAGEEYFDISHPDRGVIKAQADERVPDGCCYIEKMRVSDDSWKKLTKLIE